jgi:hypothetical protein
VTYRSESLTRRSLFSLSVLALAGAIAAPLAALLPKPKARRFVASIVIEPRFQASTLKLWEETVALAAQGDPEALARIPAAREALLAECRCSLRRRAS